MPCPLICAVMIPTSAPEAAAAWYARIFPAADRETLEMDAVPILRFPDLQIEFVPADGKSPSGTAGSIVYWSVDDFEDELARILNLGATLYRGPLRIENGQHMCQLQDPWGNCLGLRGPHTAPVAP